jgi:hypothetical protein
MAGIYLFYDITYPIRLVDENITPANWPEERLTDVDPGLTWDEENEIWTGLQNTLGGGRFKQQLIVVSEGKIYFEGY